VTTTFSPGFSRELVDLDGVAIVQQLQSQGFETYFVGGCVRDLLLNRRPKDFDVATDARPEELKRVFGRRCRIIGRRFRLAHVHVGSQIYELATFRGLPGDQEMATDDSGFVVRANTFGTAYEDAKSRDFTVNGLFYDPVSNKIIDHVGGLGDVQRRLLKTIGDADQRLREDPVRLLRAIKFAARLGFTIEQPILDAAAAAAPLIATCPAARVAEELYRMSESGHARAAWEWMQKLGVLDALLPEIAASFGGRGALPPDVLDWLGQVDRLTAAHGTLPREATFALIAWPFIQNELDRRSDLAKLSWGRFALDGVKELAVRLSVPIRHRYSLAGMADVIKRLRQLPARRPMPGHLRAYGVPLALTAQRMSFLLTGEGREAYDLWATELERLGLWAAPFEPRQDDDEGGGDRGDRGDRGGRGDRKEQGESRNPPTRSQARHAPEQATPGRMAAQRAAPADFATTTEPTFIDEPPHDERAIEDDDSTEAGPADGEGAADPATRKRRRRRRKRPGAPASEVSEP